eukprot:CAMPEP_0118992790 /NCGR_PEP_ID=MMETSP1173-20130426/53984_1 /TAXON_ID=1034831 /ORGANISM="Rhizochromulina marina cf, Strain CCMP1243" /LENGTH=65 /DNA_ID=CAMNT_0006944001 /DNA_START=101 /DNA_END=295 /DNA_ORIENTATION=+
MEALDVRHSPSQFDPCYPHVSENPVPAAISRQGAMLFCQQAPAVLCIPPMTGCQRRPSSRVAAQT